MPDPFAFIIHPLNPQRDVARKFPALGRLPPWLINLLSVAFPPVYISQIRGVQSQETGEELAGWFVACPLTPAMMLKLPTEVVYRKIVQTGRLAERLGARILGLGAFTSVVGDGGITIARRLSIPVTTGDSYTIAMAVRAVEAAAGRLELPLHTATLAVVGAYGAIGRVVAQMLAPRVRQTILVGRDTGQLAQVGRELRRAGCAAVRESTELEILQQAHLVVTVTSAVETIIQPEHLRRGCVVCDVARPRDVSRRVAAERPDVLVIEGGMVEVPGPVDFGFNFGMPPRMAYACMAETMALALDGKYESFTLGKQIQLSQVMTIDKIAGRHGFKLGGFRSFERAVTDAEIAHVLAKSRHNTTEPVGALTSEAT